MEQCEYCGGTKSNPQRITCITCNGVGRVLGLLKDDPWLGILPATSSNKNLHSDYYEHLCPKCRGSRTLLCNAWFHY